MTADLTIARNEITAQFVDRWNVQAPFVNGGVLPPIAYENMPLDNLDVEAWARIVIRHSGGGNQVTFVGEEGKALYEQRGIVVVSVFTPNEDMEDTTLAEQLSIIAQSAFQGQETPSGVEFENVVPAEAGQSTDDDAGMAWYQINVQASFKYDTAVPLNLKGSSLKNQLVSLYKLNEASGAAVDAFQSFDLIEQGTVGAFANGKIDSARGTYDVGERHARTVVPSDPFDVRGAVTVSFFSWIRFPSSPTLDPAICSNWGIPNSNEAFFLRVLNALPNDLLQFGMSDGSGGASTVLVDLGGFPVDTWIAVGFAYDALTNTISVYGKLEGQVSILVQGPGEVGGFQNNQPNEFVIGGATVLLSSLGGYMDSAGWWNGRVLNKAEFDYLALGVDLDQFDGVPLLP